MKYSMQSRDYLYYNYSPTVNKNVFIFWPKNRQKLAQEDCVFLSANRDQSGRHSSSRVITDFVRVTKLNCVCQQLNTSKMGPLYLVGAACAQWKNRRKVLLWVYIKIPSTIFHCAINALNKTLPRIFTVKIKGKCC